MTSSQIRLRNRAGVSYINIRGSDCMDNAINTIKAINGAQATQTIGIKKFPVFSSTIAVY